MASRSFRRFVEQKLGKFPHFLVYAILEWVLIILLFIDGFLSFLSNEFAKLFELRIPCVLCTRIDHVFVHKNSNFYHNDSICEDHKRDISSLAYCHMHRKLSDIQSMCEGCLLSFATEKESDFDTYKSDGILHKDIDPFVEDDRRFQTKSGRRNDVVQIEKSSSVHRCSCCGEPLKMRPNSKVMARNSSINGSLVSQAPAPSPRAPIVTWKNEEARNLELPHIRYTELKFMSDNESDLPEDEDASTVYNQSIREDTKDASVPLLPESEDINEDACKTPSFIRGNKFFGIPLTDSASASPRFATRLPRRFQLEKSELFLEPIEANTTNEADGDCILHHLKRQVRLDRRSLIALYMELDEERSASAVAANNAMAMITRLQAEKAAVQMEALQYQRMMEEQAEYDQEALQVMKGLLTKREEEFKVLEAELETYREKYGQTKKVGSEECEVDAEDYRELKSQSLSSISECGSHSEVDHNGENEPNSGRYGSLQEENGGGTLDESPLDFERERSYLLGLLTKLEKKINMSSDDETHSSQSDMVKHEDEDTGHENKAILTREVSQIREGLRAIEADSGFLKHAAMTLQMCGEGTKLLTEIAHHLRKLRQSVKMPPEDIDA
uniref:GTD-binding domain-containing protein n=1 Tax=Davidia involucrata TaxID=16924 RepID=A0A5B7A5I8_DAVIN